MTSTASRRSIVDFWAFQGRAACGWCHPEDELLLTSRPHSFNLDFPVSPYIGNVLDARVLILGANAGYDPATTPAEFEGTGRSDAYLDRVVHPDRGDWSTLHRYYDAVNYGDLISSGRAVLLNACAYRSPSISREPDNRNLIEQLPACRFTRRWLEEAIAPLARRGELLVVAKRFGLWKIAHLRGAPGFVFDPAPVSPHLSRGTRDAVNRFLQRG